MADDYRKGTEAAAADFPSNRLASRALGQLARNGFGLLPGSQAREAEFLDGYRDAHRAKSTDTQRVLQVELGGSSGAASSSTLTEGSAMSSSQNYANQVASQVNSVHNNAGGTSGTLSHQAQVDLLQELRAYLLRFETGLDKVASDYRQKVAYLEGQMMQEDHRGFEQNHLAPALSLINQLRQLIMDESVPVLDQAIGDYLNHRGI